MSDKIRREVEALEWPAELSEVPEGGDDDLAARLLALGDDNRRMARETKELELRCDVAAAGAKESAREAETLRRNAAGWRRLALFLLVALAVIASAELWAAYK